MSAFVQQGDILVAEEAWPLLKRAGLDSLDAFMGLPGGTRVVHKRGRSVYRFELEGRAFYLKRNRLHRVELLKRLSRAKLPPRSALQEWKAIEAVAAAGIPTVKPIAFGERTVFGIEVISFTVTEELYHARPLDVIVKEKFQAGALFEIKRGLISKLAFLARTLHDAGMNHQDFYLNHFFIGKEGDLYLLDLQRVQQRLHVPEGSRVKDLAQLNYSADYYGGCTRSDKLRFLKAYCGAGRLTGHQKHLIRKILSKTLRIARHDIKLAARRRRRGELPSS